MNPSDCISDNKKLAEASAVKIDLGSSPDHIVTKPLCKIIMGDSSDFDRQAASHEEMKNKITIDMMREKIGRQRGHRAEGYGDITKRDCHAQAMSEDDHAGALDRRDRIPHDQRDPKRLFSEGQAAESFQKASQAPFSKDDHERIDVTGRRVSDMPGSANRQQTDHVLAHSRGGPTTIDNARPLDGNANRRRGNEPLSEKHEELFRRDYLDDG